MRGETSIFRLISSVQNNSLDGQVYRGQTQYSRQILPTHLYSSDTSSRISWGGDP